MTHKTAHQEWKSLPYRYREAEQTGLEQWTNLVQIEAKYST
jgi:hypothetical protein